MASKKSRKERGSLYKQPGCKNYTIRIKLPGERKPRRITTGTDDEQEAQRQLDKIRGELAQFIPVVFEGRTKRFKSLFDDVLTDYQLKRRKTYKQTRGRIRKHLIPFFGDMIACQTTAKHTFAYQTQRLAEGASPSTIRRELEIVKRAFTLGESLYKITPLEFELPAVGASRTTYFTEEEFYRVYEAIKPDYRPLLKFLYVTGWRAHREAKVLRVRNCDFEHGQIRLDPGTTKNGDGRVFPMIPGLYELLWEEVAKTDGAPDSYVFTWQPMKRGQPNGPRRPVNAFYRSFVRACYKAGLPCKVEKWQYRQSKTGQIISGERVVKCDRILHDFRRSAVTNFCSKKMGLPAKLAMELTGHRDERVFDRYNIVPYENLDIVTEKLTPFLSEFFKNTAEQPATLNSNGSSIVSSITADSEPAKSFRNV